MHANNPADATRAEASLGPTYLTLRTRKLSHGAGWTSSAGNARQDRDGSVRGRIRLGSDRRSRANREGDDACPAGIVRVLGKCPIHGRSGSGLERCLSELEGDDPRNPHFVLIRFPRDARAIGSGVIHDSDECSALFIQARDFSKRAKCDDTAIVHRVVEVRAGEYEAIEQCDGRTYMGVLRFGAGPHEPVRDCAMEVDRIVDSTIGHRKDQWAMRSGYADMTDEPFVDHGADGVDVVGAAFRVSLELRSFHPVTVLSTGLFESASMVIMGSPVAPAFVRIAATIVSDIRAGVLKPGARVESTRALARTLGVHRNTVVAAYRELLSEGWLTARAGARTFVAESLPEEMPRRFRSRARSVPVPLEAVGFSVVRMEDAPFLRRRNDDTTHRARGLSLSEGAPDPRLLPTALLARSYRRALRDPRNLDYAGASGHPRLRAALASMLREQRHLHLRDENVLVTAGSQMALDLAAEALVRKGATVAVEAMGYAPAWGVFARHGARIAPIPVDGEGIDVAALARLCSKRSIAAVYVTPHHQYPTTVTLSPARRLALLELARTARFAIIEDDYDHEFHYSGRPILPLASEDRDGVVIYVGTLSKIAAPGLRLGYVAAPSDFVRNLTRLRFLRDRHGDPALECALAELLEDGDIARHVWRARRVYLARRDALLETLQRLLPSELSFTVPAGGMALWTRVREDIDVDAWATRASAEGKRGVHLRVGRDFAFDGKSKPFMRLGFAYLTEAEMHEGVETLRRTLPGRPKLR